MSFETPSYRLYVIIIVIIIIIIIIIVVVSDNNIFKVYAYRVSPHKCSLHLHL